MNKEYKASELAEIVHGTVVGNPDTVVNAVNSLKLAERNEVSFLNSAKYLKAQRESHAGIVLVPRDWKYEPPEGQTNIHCEDPDKAFTKLCAIFAPEPLDYPVGVHPTAFVHPTAKLAEGVHVGPNAVVMEGAEIGKNTKILEGAEIGKNTKICACAYIGQETKVGENTTIYPGVCIMHRCIIGNRVIIHGNAVIGADGFGYNATFRGLVKVPQNGIVRIDDDVEIGACSTIDRARFGMTWIKKGVKIDNLVFVAHNVIVGESSVLIGQAGVAGSAELGRGVVLQARAGVNGHITMGDGSKVLGCSAAQKSTPPGGTVFGVPGETQEAYLERFALPIRMRKVLARLDKLEAKLAALEAKDEGGAK